MTAIVVVIGGSDPYAGGGIQTDLMTMQAHNVFGISVLTSIVTNVNGRFEIHGVAEEIVKAQLDSLTDIHFSAIKIGLIVTKAQVDLIADFLTEHPQIPVVLDPVFALKETDERQNESLASYVMERLAMMSTVCTPNLSEARALVQKKQPETKSDLTQLAKQLVERYHIPMCVKGGARFLDREAVDVLATLQTSHTYTLPLSTKQTTNGAGCAFASAIAANLAVGASLAKAVEQAKQFVYESITQGIYVNETFASIWPKGGI